MPDQPARVPTPLVVDDPIELSRFTRWTVGTDGKRLGDSALLISGITCAACAGTIEQALTAQPGVSLAEVSAAASRARVVWDPQRTRVSALIDAITAAGYGAVPDAAAPAREMRRTEHRAALWRLFVASFCAMQVMMFATPSYVAAPGDLAPDMRQLLNWGSWVLSLPVVWFSAGPFFRGAWNALRRRRIGMDVPVALGVLVTFVASTGATFEPGGVFGSEVYFDSLTMFISFLLGARYLELRLRHRAAMTLEATLSSLPETALRLGADGRLDEVSVHRLVPGDRVRVRVGQAFPADGVVVLGQTQANEALLTGESSPVNKHEGDTVVAGSSNVGAPVDMEVERVGADTRFESIVSMMRSALTQRPAAMLLADRWAAPFLWGVLLLAAAGAAAWSLIDPSRALWVAVSVLIVTCPCALSLAAPAVLVAGAGALGRHGVMFQRLAALDLLARVNRVFIDKTGTMTEDRPRWTATVPPHSPAVVLTIAASLARWSQHPYSQALSAAVDAAQPAPAWAAVQESAGQGVEGTDAQGRRWRLGSAAWAGVGDDVTAPVWLSCDGQLQAGFLFEEVLRPDAVQAVQSLRDLGLSVTLLSGDSPTRAAALAQRLGVADVVGGATPQGKLAAVAAAQAEGAVVLMVGDGVNDAPVLARADVSLAMGQGALVARAQADAVVVSNRPMDIVQACITARRVQSIARQNLVWAAAYNLACIPMALLGWLPPWAAGLGMACSSLLVVLNALRVAR